MKATSPSTRSFKIGRWRTRTPSSSSAPLYVFQTVDDLLPGRPLGRIQSGQKADDLGGSGHQENLAARHLDRQAGDEIHLRVEGIAVERGQGAHRESVEDAEA